MTSLTLPPPGQPLKDDTPIYPWKQEWPSPKTECATLQPQPTWKGCTGAMIDWWFGWIHKAEHYALWHPRDHVFSDWEGPRENNSTSIGGHHLVHEYIGGELQKLKISFKDPGQCFGAGWEGAFQEAGYSTAVCGRTGVWDDEKNEVMYVGHLVHLIKSEPDGVRMRSRFWLGDVNGITDPEMRKAGVSLEFATGLLKHCTEEMAILANILPDIYSKYSKTEVNL
ncbi:hypothetical protein N7454_001288 [Penicillium verhagenii]|nr:hypothetical protein N7454_001288 [Penicillium verhagenii]